MSSTNLGNQKITFQYYDPAKASSLNYFLTDILPAGIYEIGDLSYSGTSITLPAFKILIKYEDKKSAIIKTTSSIPLAGIEEATPYICCSYSWLDVIRNYLDFEFKSSVGTNDICFGKALFTGGVVTSIDYSETTYGVTYKNSSYTNFNIDDITLSGIICTQELTESNVFEYFDTYELPDLQNVDSNSVITKKTVDNLKPFIPDQYNISAISSGVIARTQCLNNYYFTNDSIANDLILDLPDVESSLTTKIINAEHYNVILNFKSSDMYNNQLAENVSMIELPVKGCLYELYGFENKWIIPKIFIPNLYLMNGYTTNVVATVKEYNVASDLWNTRIASTSATYKSSSFSLSSSNGYLLGGQDSGGTNLSVNYKFDKFEETWTAETNFIYDGAESAGFQCLQKGYLVGGLNRLNRNESYNETLDTWDTEANFGINIKSHSSCGFYNKGYIVGGINGVTVLDSVYEYTPASDSWSNIATITAVRAYHVSPNSFLDIFVLGGTTDLTYGTNQRTNYKYSRIANSWTTESLFATARALHSGYGYQNKVLISNGTSNDGTTKLSDFQSYSQTTGSWNLSLTDPDTSRLFASSFTL